jgi:hypothetical protein
MKTIDELRQQQISILLAIIYQFDHDLAHELSLKMEIPIHTEALQ